MLIPNANWNGVSEITVGVSDNDTTIIEQFTLTVLPLNDAPNPFILISPIDNTIIEITQENLNDTLFIEWESSFDIDGDTVSYSLITTDGISFLTDDLIEQNKLEWSFSELVELMDSLDVVSGIWSIIAADNDITVEASNGPFTLTIDATSLNIDGEEFIPKVFALHQNYPNPFNPVTTIRYDIPEQSHVLITIYDILGRQIRIIVNEIEDPGFKSVVWDGRNQFGNNISSGIYFYQIAAKSDNDIFVHTRKLVLLR